MRKIFFILLASSSIVASAQTVATFESLTLPGLDTAYVNYTQPGQDVGFSNGYAFFPCVYDTAFGDYWNGGFAYSNERDTTTVSYLNQYAAKTGSGYAGSEKYAIYFEPYDGVRKLRLTAPAQGQAVSGFFITNTTFAYGVMKNGDALAGPRFGDFTANDTTHQRPDFLRVVARGYRNGALVPDSAEFFLADFRAASNANDYIVKDWQWFSLLPLGAVDSLDFRLYSSRNNAFGNLVPAYFAMDNFTTDETGTGVSAIASRVALKIYPNPATSFLTLESPGAAIAVVTVQDAAGRVAVVQQVNDVAARIDVARLAPGAYVLRVESAAGVATHRFIKQ